MKELKEETKTKKYKVGFWYTEYGTVIVEAETPEEAEQKVQNTLEEFGADELKDYRVYESCKINDRDYGSQDAEEVKQ